MFNFKVEVCDDVNPPVRHARGKIYCMDVFKENVVPDEYESSKEEEESMFILHPNKTKKLPFVWFDPAFLHVGVSES